MKRTLLAVVSGLAVAFGAGMALAGSAQPPVIEPVLTAAPVPDDAEWEGAYVGAVAGVQSGNLTNSLGGVLPMDSSFNGGLILGFNGQAGAFVFGGELAAQTGKFMISTANWSTDYLIDARARVGFAFDNIPVVNSVLVFAAAGVSTSTISTDSPVVRSGTASGWNAGAGVDLAVTDDIFVGGEYIYRDLSGTNNSAQPYQTQNHGIQLRAGLRF